MHFGDKVSFLQSIFISVFAMVVVFIVLLLISYVIDLVAYILKKSRGKGSNLKESGKGSVASSKAKVASNIDAKDLAIITSCIDSFQKDTNPNYKIRSIN